MLTFQTFNTTFWNLTVDKRSSQKPLFLTVDYNEFQTNNQFNNVVLYLLPVRTGSNPGDILWASPSSWRLGGQILSTSQKMKLICKLVPTHHIL